MLRYEMRIIIIRASVNAYASPPMERFFIPRFLFLLIFCLTVPAWGDLPDSRHGSLETLPPPFTLEGGTTLVAQQGNRADLDASWSASLDLVLTWPAAGGNWTLYLEGSTTPAAGALATEIGEVNADLGSALGPGGRGRLQLSVLHYAHPLAVGVITLGLLDPAGFLDRSEVAGDETRQFLAAALVNDAAIAMPSYHLGVAWHLDAQPHRPGLTLILGGSHGLAEVDGRYGELFDFTAPDKGLFAAAELYGPWRSGFWRLGAWHNGARQPRLDGAGRKSNQGAYLLVDGTRGAWGWNLRLGLADQQVAEVARFAALAVTRSAGALTAGLGLAWRGAAPDLPDAADGWHAECWVRFEPRPGLEITPDLQWLRHPGLAGGAPDLWVGGVRVTWTF